LTAGYGDNDKLLNELSLWASERKVGKIPVYLTLSGRPAHFFVSRVPKVARPLMLKALKLQMKQATGEEREEISYLALPTPQKVRETHAEYLAASLDHTTLEKLGATLRKARFRLHAWDLDFICYARAANWVWNKAGFNEATRFLILTDWDRTQLLVLSADGRLIAPSLTIGVQSFLQRLKATRDGAVPEGTEKAWHSLPAEPLDVRSRRVAANQAIHDVYIPLAQQIKAQLYAAVVTAEFPSESLCDRGPGANSFGLVEALAKDLGVPRSIFSATLPSENLAAFGAALWENRKCVSTSAAGETRVGARGGRFL